MIISFLMPGPGFVPNGGYKVLYEYANMLCENAQEVHIVLPTVKSFFRKRLNLKIKAIIKFCNNTLRRMYHRQWFSLNPMIRTHHTLSLDYNFIPQSDYYIISGAKTAHHVNELIIDKSKVIYIIQGFENWGVSDDYVYETYNFGFKNVVISQWLARLVESVNAKYTIIKNGFDFDYFNKYIPIEKKNPFTISMLYHPVERKGCKYGIEALVNVKQKFPSLRVILFGTSKRPTNIPAWIEYYKQPTRQTHNKIYNESAIFLAPSLQEGWGLTVGEAMICGAAIVCTDTLGYQEMVEDEKSALISPIKDSTSLEKNIIRLLEDNALRITLAQNGYQSIRHFTWNNSFNKLRQLLT